MLSLYRRDGQEVRVESHVLDGDYVIRVRWPDGREQSETFSRDSAFRRRLNAVESELREQKWVGPVEPTANDDARRAPLELRCHDRRSGKDRRRFTRRDRRGSRDIAATATDEPTDVASRNNDEET